MIPSKQQQIAQHHAALIVRVVQACADQNVRQELEPALVQSAENGWTALVEVIRKIISGSRDENLLAPLDEEDQAIITAILRGLQDPSTLPDPNAKADGSVAAAGLAGLIHAASRGDAPALQIIADMAEQMSQAGGDMAQIAGVIRPLVNGERDADKLSQGMEDSGTQLLISILQELETLNLN